MNTTTEIKHSDGRILLTIRHVDPDEPYVIREKDRVIWEGINEIAIELGDLHWYGQGGLVHQQYPLEKIAQYPAPFLSSDNGATGLLGILEPFWIASNGAGVWVQVQDHQTITTSFNAPLAGEPPPHSFSTPAPLRERPPLAAEIQTDGLLRISGEGLRIVFFTCNHAREVVECYWRQIQIAPPPPSIYFEKPLWTTWAQFKNNINHEQVIDYAQKILDPGFSCSTLGIDAKWQNHFGDTRFDPMKFPDPQQTIDQLHDMGMKVTLWCVPFYASDSQHFQPAIEQGHVIKKRHGSPYIGAWWEGTAAYLDVTNPAALRWHLDNLQRLADQYGIDGFKFDAGEGMFYNIPESLRFDHQSANHANQLYILAVAQRYPWSDVRSGWRTQAAPTLFRQWDKSSTWGFDNGLASCITQAITLNLLGYPYSFPDMIGGNHYGEQIITAELLIRWTQAVAPMPIIQFSLAPWDYGEECAQICARYAEFHTQLAAYTRQVNGLIVRPLWWLDPHDDKALSCADQYVVGDHLLVAPIIEAGARQRHIYLPAGTWRSYWNREAIYRGKQHLIDYPASLDTLPLFEKVDS